MSDLAYIHATITRRGALGIVEANINIDGTAEFVSEKLTQQVELAIETMTPGDRMTIDVVHELPADHPLAGVDLSA